MSTPTSGGASVRQSFPETRRCVLGIVLFPLALGMVAAPAFFKGGAEARSFWLGGWVVVAMVWWALMGTRMCLLIDRMLALRLPRIGATLRNGVALHLALSIGLPVLVMLLWQPAQATGETAIPALAAALWLGSTAGLLIISLPLPAAFVPGLALSLGWDMLGLGDPATRFAAGCTALLLAGLSWQWHAARQRHFLLAPFGVWLEDPTLQIRTIERWPGPALGRQNRARTDTWSGMTKNSQTLLANMLGVNCQTVRQIYGRHGQWLTWLIFVMISAAFLAYGHGYFGDVQRSTSKAGNVYMITLAWFVLLNSAHRPSSTLWAMHKKRHAQRAELLLAPGLPPLPQLEQAVMRQVFLSLRERILLAAISMPALLYPVHWLSPWWALWWMGFCALSLLLGLYSAWLAWHGQTHGLAWAIAVILLSFGTHWWLLVHPHAPPVWIPLAWAVFLLWTLIRYLHDKNTLRHAGREF